MSLKTNPVIEALVERGVVFSTQAIQEIGHARVLGEENTSPIIMPREENL